MWNGMLKFRAKFASKNLLIKMIISYVLTGAILLLLTLLLTSSLKAISAKLKKYRSRCSRNPTK